MCRTVESGSDPGKVAIAKALSEGWVSPEAGSTRAESICVEGEAGSDPGEVAIAKALWEGWIPPEAGSTRAEFMGVIPCRHNAVTNVNPSFTGVRGVSDGVELEPLEPRRGGGVVVPVLDGATERAEGEGLFARWVGSLSSFARRLSFAWREPEPRGGVVLMLGGAAERAEGKGLFARGSLSSARCFLFARRLSATLRLSSFVRRGLVGSPSSGGGLVVAGICPGGLVVAGICPGGTTEHW